MSDDTLRDTVEGPLRAQAMILKGTALVAGLLGGLLLVGAVITALKPQEELSVKITMLVFSLLMVAGSAYLWVHLTRHFQAARAIIFERPRDIAEMRLRAIERGGTVVSWSVQITDKAGKQVGVAVSSEQAGTDVIRRIEALRA